MDGCKLILGTERTEVVGKAGWEEQAWGPSPRCQHQL